MTDYLFSADLDQIQAYIFGTDRMCTIRGASALIAKFGEDVYKKAKRELGADCRCLRYHGGQLVFLTDEPEKLALVVRQEAQKIGGGALGATIAWDEYPGDSQFSSSLFKVFEK